MTKKQRKQARKALKKQGSSDSNGNGSGLQLCAQAVHVDHYKVTGALAESPKGVAQKSPEYDNDDLPPDVCYALASASACREHSSNSNSNNSRGREPSVYKNYQLVYADEEEEESDLEEANSVSDDENDEAEDDGDDSEEEEDEEDEEEDTLSISLEREFDEAVQSQDSTTSSNPEPVYSVPNKPHHPQKTHLTRQQSSASIMSSDGYATISPE